MLANVAAALPFAFFVDRIESCQEKMYDPNTSDYDHQRLTLEKSEYQNRINDMLAIKYAMLFAEQERK